MTTPYVEKYGTAQQWSGLSNPKEDVRSGIPQAMEQLRAMLGKNMDLIRELEGRLQPVLGPRPSEPPKNVKEMDRQDSLRDNLNGLGRTIEEDHNSLLERILSSLEL